MTLEAYAKARKEFRAQVLAHKKTRTVHLGEHVTLLFEDELTIRYQVQEMLRIEKTFEEAGIQDELDAYNPLVPDGSNFKATMLIEYEDVDERQARAGASCKGIEDRVWVQVEGCARVVRDRRRGPRARERREDLGRAFPALRAHAGMIGGAEARRGPLRIGVDHPNYQAAHVSPSRGRARADVARRRSAPEQASATPPSAAAQSRKLLILEREVGDRLLDERDRVLQVVALGAGHAHGVALDRRLHLELAVLHQLDDLLRELLLDAGAHRDRLLHLVAGDLLRRRRT